MTWVLIYLLLLGAVFLLQRKIMYFPARFTVKQQQVLLDELNLQSWSTADEVRGFISNSPPHKAKGTVLVFHGNAGSAVHRSGFIQAIQSLGYRVIIAEYPGYGTRDGSPSEAVLIKDGIATAKIAQQAFSGPLFLCGESLGSGVVAGIVASNEVSVKGLLLITPFDSMVNVAQHHYWYFFARWLTLDRYDNVSKLRDFQGAVAVVLAEEDEIVPNRNTMVLFNSLSAPKKMWRFEHAGHNNLPMESWRSWWSEVMQFIDR